METSAGAKTPSIVPVFRLTAPNAERSIRSLLLVSFVGLLLLVVCAQSLQAEETVTGQLLGQWPGYLRGGCRDVQVVGDRVYAALGTGGLAVFDASDPTNLRRLGGVDAVDASDVEVVNDLAYVAASSDGVQVFNVVDPSDIRWVGGIETDSSTRRLHLVGGLAYVAFSGGVLVLDTSEPTALKALGVFYIDGSASDLDVQGTQVFVVGSGGLTVLDVSDPSNIRQLGNARGFFGNVFGVRVAGDLAYVAYGRVGTDAWPNGGLQVFDISDPEEVRQVGRYDTAGSADCVSISGQTAYLTLRPGTPALSGQDEGLQVLDISVPADIQRLALLATNGDAQGVYLEGSLAYVATSDGLEVVDITAPSGIRRLGRTSTAGRAFEVEIRQNVAYVADSDAGLQVLDVSDPSRIRWLGEYRTPTTAIDLQVAGTRAYVVETDDWFLGTLRVLNVRDPANIALLGDYELAPSSAGSPGNEVEVEGDFAYVAGGWGGFEILNVKDPENIRRVNQSSIVGRTSRVEVGGGLAVVGGGYAGDAATVLVDVSDPENARSLGEVSGGNLDVRLVGDVGYFTQGFWDPMEGFYGSALRIVDLSDPVEVHTLGGYSNSNGGLPFLERVQVVGDLIFLSDTDARLTVLDGSDPSHVRELGSYSCARTPWSIQVIGNLAFLAVREAGLQIVRLSGGPGFQPGLLLEPVDLASGIGGSVHFHVAAAGDEPLSYQWQKDGQPLAGGERIAGETTAVLTIQSVQVSDQGEYSVTVSNPAGDVTSRSARLTIAPSLTIREADGQISLTVQAPDGMLVEIQTTDRLPSDNWRTLMSLTAGPTPVTVTDPDPISFSERYYRATVNP